MEENHGYKAFYIVDGKMKCRDFVFEIGQTYKEPKAMMCSSGFHYCKSLFDVFAYYPLEKNLRICEITDLGQTITRNDKCCTTRIKIDKLLDGIIEGHIFKNGILERDGEITNNSMTFWYKNGKIHRDGVTPPNDCEGVSDEPSIIKTNGDKEWYKNGKTHRDGDKPAIIGKYGDKEWNKDGKTHRDGDEPAIIYANGHKEWYKDGKLHRDDDKPAVILPDGCKIWYTYGNYRG